MAATMTLGDAHYRQGMGWMHVPGTNEVRIWKTGAQAYNPPPRPTPPKPPRQAA